MNAPTRYTASNASVKSTRLRRSGIRNTFASASKNLFIGSSPACSQPESNLLSFRFRSRRFRDHLGGAARFLNLVERCLRIDMRLHADFPGQLTVAQNLDAR